MSLDSTMYLKTKASSQNRSYKASVVDLYIYNAAKPICDH